MSGCPVIGSGMATGTCGCEVTGGIRPARTMCGLNPGGLKKGASGSFMKAVGISPPIRSSLRRLPPSLCGLRPWWFTTHLPSLYGPRPWWFTDRLPSSYIPRRSSFPIDMDMDMDMVAVTAGSTVAVSNPASPSSRFLLSTLFFQPAKRGK